MNEDDKYLKVKEIHEKARQHRGRFLNSVACIESKISRILTVYFCADNKEKQELFFETMLIVLSLEQKKALLIKIIKKDYPRFYKENQRILKDLDNVQTFRNKLAHSVIDLSDDALKRPAIDGVGFMQYEKGKPITEKEFQDWIVKTNMISSCLIDVFALLPFVEVINE